MPQLKLIPPGEGYIALTEAVTTEYASLLDLVRQALREKVRLLPGGGDYYTDVQGIWADRVVCRTNGRLYSYTYTVQADNTIAIGDGAEVVVSYSAVREAAADGQAAFREAADGSIEVTIIRSGTSLNGNFYPDTALKAAVPLFEGVRVFRKPDAEHIKGGRNDIDRLLGGIYGVRFVEGATPDTGALVGTFKALDATDPAVTKMVEAVRKGMQNLMGLSIDAEAHTKREKRGDRTVRVAQKFAKVNSVDLIVEPGAGGGLDRLTEAADPNAPNHPTPEKDGEPTMKIRLLEALAVLSVARAAGIDAATATDDQVLAALKEACLTAGVDLGKVVIASTETDVKAAVGRLVEAAGAAALEAKRLAEAANQGDNAPLTRAELAQHQARLYAMSAIATAALPQVAKDKLQADFKARERFSESVVDDAIKAEREYLARFSESGRPTGGMPRIEVGDRRLVIASMLDAFFDPAHKDHRAVHSFKECYKEMTGDINITGRPDRARLVESIGTDTFADALGSSITRRMQAVYRDNVAYDSWRAVTVTAPVNDFRIQERTQIGGFGDLPAVAERGAYTAFADPTDDKATYQVTKRGGLAQITMEAIKNDDVGAIRRVPVELGRSSKRTLFKFVFNFFAANAATWDGVALYHATHANLGTAALDAASLAAARLMMKKQVARDTATRMEIGPKYLLVPDDLEEAATNLFNRNTNNDKTFVQTLSLSIIPVPTWTDANDWVTVADPMDIPVLEIGFLDGQEEPVLLTQDSPTEGSVFTNDLISYKVRHIYGGNVLVDGHKGTTKNVVP